MPARCCSPASATTCVRRWLRCAPQSRAFKMVWHPIRTRYFGIIAGQLDNVEGLLDQLVEYARIESGSNNRERTTVSIAELAHEAVEALSPVAHRMDVDVQLESDGPAVVVASTTDMSRVLRNLLDNAIRHSPSGRPCTSPFGLGTKSKYACTTKGRFSRRLSRACLRTLHACRSGTQHPNRALRSRPGHRPGARRGPRRAHLARQRPRRRRALLDSPKGTSMSESSSPPTSETHRTAAIREWPVVAAAPIRCRWPAWSPVRSPSPSACSSPASSMSSRRSTRSVASSSTAYRRGSRRWPSNGSGPTTSWRCESGSSSLLAIAALIVGFLAMRRLPAGVIGIGVVRIDRRARRVHRPGEPDVPRCLR